MYLHNRKNSEVKQVDILLFQLGLVDIPRNIEVLGDQEWLNLMLYWNEDHWSIQW